MCGPCRISNQVFPESRLRYVFTFVGSKLSAWPTFPVARITPGALACEYTEPRRVSHVPTSQEVEPCRCSAHVPWHEMGLPLTSTAGGASDCHAPPLLYVTRVCTNSAGSPTAPGATWLAKYTPGIPSTLMKSTAPPR